MPVRFHPPGTPLTDNSPFKGSSVIVGCFKAPKVEQTEQAVAQPAQVPSTELEDEKKAALGGQIVEYSNCYTLGETFAL